MGWRHVLPFFRSLWGDSGVAGMPGDSPWRARLAARSWSVRVGSGCPKCQSERWGGIVMTRRLITGLPGLEIS